jgi:tetratricopeptide (TPR) repeat protein
LEFFPNSDATKEPLVSDPADRRFILNRVGFCLMSLGRLAEAPTFFERYVAGNIAAEDWRNASRGYQNLADLHAHLGDLPASADAAAQALALARRAENKGEELTSLARQAWAAHLRGDLEAAGAAFQQAEALGREIDPTKSYRYSIDGIWHADHLRRAGDPAYARRVTEANLEICERNRWPKSISQCHRVLGDLDADAGDREGARAHYDRALHLARGITYRPALIEALLASGRWAARHADLTGTPNLSGLGLDTAFADLGEALAYATDSGYRIYEADTRIALAWAHLSPLTPTDRPRSAPSPPEGRGENLRQARAEAERARQMSVEMGYHWGRVDAEEVLEVIGKVEE